MTSSEVTMTLIERIQGDVKDAMKAGDGERRDALRMFVAALQNEAKSRLRDLDDTEEIAVLTRERKKRVEAAELFDQGGASDKAAAERSQIELIDGYLPAQLAPDELAAMIAAAIAETGASSPRDMGAVMKALKPKVAGRADGKVVSDGVREALAGS